MKIISLNIRGLSSRPKNNWVRELCLSVRPTVIGIQETKINNIKEEMVEEIWGNKNFNYVHMDAIGNSGGILTIWDPVIISSVNAFGDEFFTAIECHWKGYAKKCMLFNVYGPHSPALKKLFWAKLDNIISSLGIDCMDFGDFNEVRNPNERLNSKFCAHNAVAFNKFIMESSLLEVQMENRKFTRICSEGIKFSKLDRFLVSPGFMDRCSSMGVKVLDRKESDHSPLLCSDNFVDSGPKPFKFFNSWLEDAECDMVVKKAWSVPCSSVSPDCIFMMKLKKVKNELKTWAKGKFGNIDKEIKVLKDEVSRLEASADADTLSKDLRHVWISKRNLWFEKERVKSNMVRQKTRLKWNAEGEENSKFFHSMINMRRKYNNIVGIWSGGKWLDHPESIKRDAATYFQNLFGAPGMQKATFSSDSFKKLSPSDKDSLEKEWLENEIWEAVKNCGSDKASGPDGFNFKFIKHYWSLIKEDLTVALKWFWASKKISPGCNSSFITLVPKVCDLNSWSDFRPINLIGCYYKIISKVLANRLKVVINSVIGDIQSAFIKNRSILDSFQVASEVLNDMKTSKCKSFIFKIDFEKAFDSIRWDFLFHTMNQMGFGQNFIDWVKACLQTSRMSVLINGSPSSEFNVYKWVRQGDPMAPYLFLIVAEGFNIMFQEAVNNDIFKGYKVGKDKVLVSHLQYADDTMVFGLWSRKNLTALSRLLKCWEDVSGLKVNWRKSRLMSTGITKDESAEMASWLGFQMSNETLFYLGFPVNANMKHAGHWDKLIEKIESRLDGWRGKLLSYGDRFTLLNAVMSALPVYYLSVFRAPSIEDRWMFNLHSSNTFSVKALRDLLQKKKAEINSQDQANQDHNLSTFWSRMVPKKILIFGWRADKNNLPVRCILADKGLDIPSLLCQRCSYALESVSHALFLCPCILHIWQSVHQWWGIPFMSRSSFSELSNNAIGLLKSDQVELWNSVLRVTAYTIWTNRNKLVFVNSQTPTNSILFEMQLLTFHWFKARDSRKKWIWDWNTWMSSPNDLEIRKN